MEIAVPCSQGKAVSTLPPPAVTISLPAGGACCALHAGHHGPHCPFVIVQQEVRGKGVFAPVPGCSMKKSAGIDVQ